MTTIPCFAAVGTAKAELPKGKLAFTVIFWLATSYIVSMAVYLIGSWWWASFIFLAIIAVAIISIHFINKYKDNKRIVGA